MAKSAEQVLELRFNAPNAVTALRIVLALSIALVLGLGGKTDALLAGILLSIAWATDGLDGFIARRLGQTTLGGALFDLIADRVLMTTIVILSVAGGLWSRTATLMPFNPYPFAVIVIAGDLTILAGVLIFIWKQRRRVIEFPLPTQIAKITYSLQMLTLVICLLNIFPDILFAVVMYLTIICTLFSFYSYLKKGSYIFTS